MSTTFTTGDFVSAAASLGSGSGSGETSGASNGTDSSQNSSGQAAQTDTSLETTGQPQSAEADGTTPQGELAEAADTANTAAPVHHDPPKERWETILNNAREKARAEVEAQYSWAKDIDPSEVQAVRGWMQAGNENPLAALDHLVRGIASMPGQAAQLDRYFRHILGIAEDAGQGGRAPAPDDAMPQPDIPTDQSNGQPVVYSAQQLQKLLQWQASRLRQDITQEFQTELSPIVRDRQETQIRQQANAYAARAVGEIASQPGFTENKDEIARVWDKMPRNDGRTEGERLYAAYIQVVAPKFSDQARQEAVADVTRKAGATTINPTSGASGGQAFDYSKASWADALRHEVAKRERK